MFIKEDVRHTMKVKMVKKNSKSYQKNKACHESNTGQKISKTNRIKLEQIRTTDRNVKSEINIVRFA